MDRILPGVTVGISQPTFLPWSGFFSLIAQCDVFVFLDTVEYSHQSWQQRNRIRGPNGLEWITVPILKTGKSGQSIRETEIDTKHGFPRKAEESLRHNYGKSDSWSSLGQAIVEALGAAAEHRSLSKLNIELIRLIAGWLRIDTDFVVAAENTDSLSRTDYLAELVANNGGINYLSSPGSLTYLSSEQEPFERRDIAISIHAYSHPTYRQRFTPFIPFASVVDLLFSEEKNPLEVIRSGELPPAPL